MPLHNNKTEHFKGAENTKDKAAPADKVPVYANRSMMKKGPAHDPLTKAMSFPDTNKPDYTHVNDIRRTVPQSKGHNYEPRGEFGKVNRQGSGKGVYSYGGAPNKKGDNPLGSNSNRKGDNPLGRAMNRVGTNAVGSNKNRKGANPIGNAPNRYGQKSGYPAFRPSAGGKQP